MHIKYILVIWYSGTHVKNIVCIFHDCKIIGFLEEIQQAINQVTFCIQCRFYSFNATRSNKKLNPFFFFYEKITS